MKEITMVVWEPPKVSNKYQKNGKIKWCIFGEQGWEYVILEMEIIFAG